MYAWRGLLTHAPSRLDDRPNQLTLIASRGTTMFGTLTLSLDSPEGLCADELYADEIAAARQRGARVCELTRLAIDPAFNSKEVLGSIFHLAYIFGRLVHGMSDLFIEVNPRHVGFYTRMLGFRVAGEERICPRVEAPAVLLHLPLDYVDEQISHHASLTGSGERNLYTYFFSAAEQQGLLRRLQSDPAVLEI
ncbi:N-acetyltransferase [Nitrogeniibacter mangrovi]|uniref:N-acetyltransferase n=2 Tax=Nitrogeniibacter mangrovi TaxID=2016596 RepID=A0A6C1B7W5_9RHOO|nr:N-acetyltransferase [Nitrogeniibacter mangrovi]